MKTPAPFFKGMKKMFKIGFARGWDKITLKIGGLIYKGYDLKHGIWYVLFMDMCYS